MNLCKNCHKRIEEELEEGFCSHFCAWDFAIRYEIEEDKQK